MTSECARSTSRSTDGVDFVDEDDGRSDLSGFAEQLAHPPRADTNDHRDEFRRARAAERYPCLTSGGTGQQCLACPRRTGEQYSFGGARTKPAVLLGLLQEVDHFVDFGFDLIDP